MILTTLIATMTLGTGNPAPLPYGERRGIQALYFARFPPEYVQSICDALDTAPDKKKLEIAMCPAFAAASQEWLNVNAAIDRLKDRDLYVTIHFGHHSMATDYTLDGWADSFYDHVFSSNYSRAKFCISMANEDKYTDSKWKALMTSFIKRLKADWDEDHSTDGKKFPVGSLIVRRNTLTGSTLNGKFKVEGIKKDFATESEYHFPEDGSQRNLATSGYSVFCNDGQVVYDTAQGEGSHLAKNKSGHFLASMTMKNFKKKWGGRQLLLWHPQFHLWPLENGIFMYKDPRELPSANLQAYMVEVIKDFVRN